MLAPMQCKRLPVIKPAAILDNASAVTDEIDGAGWEYLEVSVMLGATDIAMAALKMQESDTTGTGFADIVGTRFGTDANDTGSTSSLPSATDDNKIFTFLIDLRGRKRFLDLVATAGDGTAGTYICAWATLWRGADGPRTALEGGSAQRMVL